MKVKMVCNINNETREIELPINADKLLEIQGKVLNRDTLGYIEGADVIYYDQAGEVIDNIFSYNKSLQ